MIICVWGKKRNHISQVYGYTDGLKLAVTSFEKFRSLTDQEVPFDFYEYLGNAYYLLDNCQYALSTWLEGLSISGVNYTELSSIRKFFGEFSLIPYKMFLCMQGQGIKYGVTLKKNYLTFEIINELSKKWEGEYLDLKAGKISPEEAVLKSTIRTEKLGELIYYLDQLYFEENNKHNRDLLERAVLCGDKDAFEILRGM